MVPDRVIAVCGTPDMACREAAADRIAEYHVKFTRPAGPTTDPLNRWSSEDRRLRSWMSFSPPDYRKTFTSSYCNWR